MCESHMEVKGQKAQLCPKGGSCGHGDMVGHRMQKYRRCSKGWEDVYVRPSPLLQISAWL